MTLVDRPLEVEVAGPARRPGPVLELTGEATSPGVLVRDVWRARRLLLVFAQQDFRARYRSAALGVLWSVLLPLVQGAVFAVVFTRVVHIPVQGGINYPAFVITGTMAWGYVTSTLTAGSTALVDRGDIAGKIYFPRTLLPAVAGLANLPSLIISFAVAFLVSVIAGVKPTAWLLLLPVAAVAFLVLATLVCEVAALLHVYFRDVRYIVTAVTMLALYASPVIYPLANSHGLAGVLSANPATGPLQLVRQAYLGSSVGGLAVPLLWTAGWCLVLLGVTVFAYARHERVAMDRL